MIRGHNVDQGALSNLLELTSDIALANSAKYNSILISIPSPRCCHTQGRGHLCALQGRWMLAGASHSAKTRALRGGCKLIITVAPLWPRTRRQLAAAGPHCGRSRRERGVLGGFGDFLTLSRPRIFCRQTRNSAPSENNAGTGWRRVLPIAIRFYPPPPSDIPAISPKRSVRHNRS
jgi:hypothetical protein